MLLWKIARRLLTIFAIVLVGGLISATPRRLAHGFDTDEHHLDPTLSAESIHALEMAKAGEHNILSFYGEYLKNATRGDLGISHALGQPVQSLIRERWSVTLRIVAGGLLLGWF